MTNGVLLDIAGVLHDGDRVTPGAVEAVARLRGAGVPVRFLTNSTQRPKRRVVERLNALGFAVQAPDVLTPAAAACAWLRREGRVPHLLVHPDLQEEFADIRGSGKVAVVVGDAGKFFTYERLNAAFRQLEAGAPLLALAANRVFRDADGGLSLDAGAFVRALEYSSGQQATLFGKPAATFFHAAAESLGCDFGRVAMIGDDAESDVAGALSAGLGAGILVRTGKYRAGDEDAFQPRPTAVAADVGEAVDLVLRGRRD